MYMFECLVQYAFECECRVLRACLNVSYGAPIDCRCASVAVTTDPWRMVLTPTGYEMMLSVTVVGNSLHLCQQWFSVHSHCAGCRGAVRLTNHELSGAMYSHNSLQREESRGT